MSNIKCAFVGLCMSDKSALMHGMEHIKCSISCFKIRVLLNLVTQSPVVFYTSSSSSFCACSLCPSQRFVRWLAFGIVGLFMLGCVMFRGPTLGSLYNRRLSLIPAFSLLRKKNYPTSIMACRIKLKECHGVRYCPDQ
jgi:hypothetical protein